MGQYIAHIQRATGTIFVRFLIWFVVKIYKLWARRVSKISVKCQVACFIECWEIVSESKPVDLRSPAFKQIFDAIDFYFHQASNRRSSVGTWEAIILPLVYAKWLSRADDEPKRRPIFRFVLKYRLAKIIHRYLNIQYQINAHALEKVRSFDKSAFEFWDDEIWPSRLPTEIRENNKIGKIRVYLRRRVKILKRDLAQKNYWKIDFSTSDLTAVVTLSATLLLLLSYMRVAAVSTYFGVPYQAYFRTSDYVANSIGSIDKYLLAGFAALLFGFFYLATLDAYSLRSSFEKVPLADRAHNWFLAFVGFSAIAALMTVYWNQQRIDPVALFGAGIFLGSWVLGQISVRFFSNPVKAFLFLYVGFVIFWNGIVGVLREIEQINHSIYDHSKRAFRFDDAIYREPHWWVFAITTDFFIFRNQSNGAIQVRPKSALKAISPVDTENIQINE